MTPAGFRKTQARIGEASPLAFSVHPHMLRHACGFKLANDGHDTRALQHYLGHKTPSGIPTWRPTGSRTFGEINVVDAPSGRTSSTT